MKNSFVLILALGMQLTSLAYTIHSNSLPGSFLQDSLPATWNGNSSDHNQGKRNYRIGGTIGCFDDRFGVSFGYWLPGYNTIRFSVNSRLETTIFAGNYPINKVGVRRVGLVETLVVSPWKWKFRPELGVGARLNYNLLLYAGSRQANEDWAQNSLNAIGPRQPHAGDYQNRWQLRPLARFGIVADLNPAISTRFLIEGEQALSLKNRVGGIFQHQYLFEICFGLGR
ncbi:MAG: hypothetical protein ACFB10_19290 [Salibacteraceae bacterium]